jgi:CBS domain-containing protein
MSVSGAARSVTTRLATAKDLGAVPVSAVMSRDVPVVDGHDPVIEVWQRLHELGTALLH